MKVIFAGTPEFAALALEAIIAAGIEVPLVLTQPDRPAGRGQKLQASAVKQVALAHGIPVYQPERLKDPASHEPIRAAGGDVMVVAAYGLILPQAVLDIPPLGCINIHASLLPRWRGAAPIQRAIEAGDAETGVAIMSMEAGLDTGPVLLMKSLPITDNDTAASLHDKLAEQGARLIVDALKRLHELVLTSQPEEGVTYARKIEKAEGLIDWQRPAEELGRRIRAFNPFPGAATQFGETPIKVWNATLAEGAGTPGTVLEARSNRLVVACGQGALALTELQKPGGKRLATADFLNSLALAPGDRLGG
ncbi:methionyl-tRNA formyltransferase [Denitratisoma oestradiolicum]|uniref:Methionyl-tRNA formyltransferase n=1 Tax=Denitratisoma oestradiolicum TaxID=311182 RepID=A0A6S6YE30_9PROT|nr:methionyl-tRNA formyltransferase [Denitratisoma oestradiolicum]TWO79209.1 methionyl-tRNA formyltransferase [Denitratisoma oestradiolicum]CAB1370856.1 10-formyltetrahydrofolate:L-methionyl-tRNA(fMet) N-formyltransferase [Denitratisoma oestradiolicum]